MRHLAALIESQAEFDARIDAENALAMTIECPLHTCLASIGKPCTTDSGVERIRHMQRIWNAKKEEANGKQK